MDIHIALLLENLLFDIQHDILLQDMILTSYVSELYQYIWLQNSLRRYEQGCERYFNCRILEVCNLYP